MEVTLKILIYVLVIGMFLFRLWLSNLNYKNRNAEIPEEVNDIYNEKDYSKWLEYTMENHRFSLLANTVSTVIFLLLLAFNMFPVFDQLSTNISSNAYLNVPLFIGFYYIISFIIGLPFSYYDTFVIEEKYGFNKATKKTFWIDKVKGLILTIVLGGGFICLLVFLNRNVGDMFFIYTWASIIIIILVVQMLYVRVIVPIFNKLTPLEEGELKDLINEFANKVGYEVTKISVMDASKRSTKLNAFFVGFGRFKQIVLFDTLIEKMSNEEIVAVLAHEIGHNKHKHIIFNLFQMAITVSVYIGTLILVMEVPEFSTAFGFDGVHFGFTLILFTILLSPISMLLNLITAYLSRKHEFQADHFAAYHFDKLSMETALKVLAKENYANLTPHPLYVKLLYSHPPIYQRIKEIRKVEQNV